MIRTVRFWVALLGLAISVTSLGLACGHPRSCVLAPIVVSGSGPQLEPTPPACIPRKP
jgi:hypothetical protein